MDDDRGYTESVARPDDDYRKIPVGKIWSGGMQDFTTPKKMKEDSDYQKKLKQQDKDEASRRAMYGTNKKTGRPNM
jgi:hypothetical protein